MTRPHLVSLVLSLGLVSGPALAGQPATARAVQASSPQPDVAAGAYERLEPVPLYAGVPPTPPDWAGRIQGEVAEAASANGATLYNVVTPSYTAYLPSAARNTRTAVIVAPGGGFRQLSVESEGNRVATWLAERGVAAFVVKYRLVQQQGPPYSMMARMQEMPMDVAGAPAVQDTVRTIAMVRAKAADYNIDAARVVAIGFSAGAHAVAHAALNTDVAARPNYVAPIYGGPFGGIPPVPPADSPDRLPPMFLAMAQDDTLVGNDVRAFYAELFAKGYRPEMHLYMSGGHGFGMNVTKNTSDLFIDQFFAWMRAQGLTQKPGDPDQRPAAGRGGRRGGGPGRSGGA